MKRNDQELQLEFKLFLVSYIIILFVMILFSAVLISQIQTYGAAINVELNSDRGVDHSAVLAYSRSTDFMVVKLSALFLSYILVFLGSLYVLRIAKTNFDVSIADHGKKGFALSTSSPGLVMIALGVLLIIFISNTKSHIEYRPLIPNARVSIVEDIAD